MATEKKTAATEGLSVEERLKTLYQLQTLLSQIDRIKNLRGELPLEVKDMDDEVERLKTRIQKFKNEAEELRKGVAAKKRGNPKRTRRHRKIHRAAEQRAQQQGV